MGLCTKTQGCVFTMPKDSTNQPSAHAGPCRLISDCVCDLAGQTFAEPQHYCEVHQRRAPTQQHKDREVAMAALAPELRVGGPGVKQEDIIAAEKQAQAETLAAIAAGLADKGD
jgi:hypothetical protein